MRTICKNLRALILMACVLLCACHTTRHTVSVVDAEQDTQSTHHEQTTTQRLDSLISTLSASADSITIELYGDAPAPVADSLNPVAPSDQASPVTAKPQPSALSYTRLASTKRKGMARMCVSRPTWPIAHGAIPSPTHPLMTLKRSSVALNHQT